MELHPSAEKILEKTGPRDLRLDFFRGLSLFFIFVDHIPDNSLSYFTVPLIAFNDAAEVFIFISGYTAALVYGRALLHRGFLFSTAQILRRVWQLYVAHIFLFVIYTAEVSYSVLTFSNPLFYDESRVGDFLVAPHIAVIETLFLQFQPTFLDILPLYIVLLGTFPLVLLLLRRHSLLALLPSLGLYIGAQRFDLALTAYPQDHLWFFNPFAWQFLFVIGGTLGYGRVTGRNLLPDRRWLIWPAGLFAVFAAIVNVSWMIHGIEDSFPGLLLKELWPIDKNNLALLRLVNFLALATLVMYFVSPDSAFLRMRIVLPVLLCGRQSLHVFCVGILLSVLGHFILTELYSGITMELVVNGIGFSLMVGTAALVEWYRKMDRYPPPLSSPSSSTPLSPNTQASLLGDLQ